MGTVRASRPALEPPSIELVVPPVQPAIAPAPPAVERPTVDDVPPRPAAAPRAGEPTAAVDDPEPQEAPREAESAPAAEVAAPVAPAQSATVDSAGAKVDATGGELGEGVALVAGTQGPTSVRGSTDGQARRGAVGGSATGSLDVAAYLRQLRALVDRHRRYPELAMRMGLEGMVVVHVVLSPNGTLVEHPRVDASCGHELLDHEALRIVERSAPFPPLSGRSAPVALKVPVVFHLDN
jgi:protein TonB